MQNRTSDPVELILAPVTHDSKGRPFPKSPGMGVFAKDPFTEGQIIGEYTGALTVHGDDADNPYALTGIDALQFRNGTAQTNDGFPNAFLASFHKKNFF